MSSRIDITRGQQNKRKKQSRNRKRQRRSDQKDNRWKNKAQLEQELKWEEEEIQPIKDVLTKVQQSSQTNLAPLQSLDLRHFKLWSTDHVKYCTVEVAPVTYIEFYGPKFSTFCPEGQIGGHIYAVSDEMCDIDPFIPPKDAGLKSHRIDGNDGQHSFEVQFLDNHHLILKIPKELVFYRQEMKPPSDAPDIFTYYGICEAYVERRVLANNRREDQKERRRSASPA